TSSPKEPALRPFGRLTSMTHVARYLHSETPGSSLRLWRVDCAQAGATFGVGQRTGIVEPRTALDAARLWWAIVLPSAGRKRWSPRLMRGCASPAFTPGPSVTKERRYAMRSPTLVLVRGILPSGVMRSRCAVPGLGTCATSLKVLVGSRPHPGSGAVVAHLLWGQAVGGSNPPSPTDPGDYGPGSARV